MQTLKDFHKHTSFWIIQLENWENRKGNLMSFILFGCLQNDSIDEWKIYYVFEAFLWMNEGLYFHISQK